MKNPLRTNPSISEDSDDSIDSEADDSADQSRDLDAGISSESDPVKQDNSEDSESEDESESESDSESENSAADKDEEFDHKWEELRNEAPDTDEVTRRIAVCNMDWDRIRAVDLLVCFNSFKPADGVINSVKVYPSEFGLKRIEEEERKGPPELVEETLPVDQEEEGEDKKGSKYHREKLRQYQINRLKYYYAVVDCDTPETANAIYEQLNGMEYESSSVRFDLRFIPDDMTFDQKPTSAAEKAPSDYKPRLFVTSALQQVKVDLTWDETHPKRREFFQKIFTDIDSVEDDIQNYLASASSESEEEVSMVDDDSDKKMKTSDKIAKYKELLKSLEDKEKQENEEKIDVEVTWEPALKEKTAEKVKEKIKKDSLNPFEELLLKKKEQKKTKKHELKKQKQDEDSEEDSEDDSLETVSNEKSKKDKKLAELALISDYKNETESVDKSSSKKKKRNKEKSKDLDGFVADMSDPRFSAIHTSSLFNMVPSEHTKKTDGKFGLKRSKEGKFKQGFQKNKKARHHK